MFHKKKVTVLFFTNITQVLHAYILFSLSLNLLSFNLRVPDPFHSSGLCSLCTAKVVIFHSVKVFCQHIHSFDFTLVHYKCTSYFLFRSLVNFKTGHFKSNSYLLNFFFNFDFVK